MDDDADLITRLSARAGMIMEDECAQAITMASQTDAARTATLIRLASATHTMNALINAALALDHEAGR